MAIAPDDFEHVALHVDDSVVRPMCINHEKAAQLAQELARPGAQRYLATVHS